MHVLAPKTDSVEQTYLTLWHGITAGLKQPHKISTFVLFTNIYTCPKTQLNTNLLYLPVNTIPHTNLEIYAQCRNYCHLQFRHVSGINTQQIIPTCEIHSRKCDVIHKLRPLPGVPYKDNNLHMYYQHLYCGTPQEGLLDVVLLC